MPVSVVDASALTAVVFGEPKGPAVAEMLEGETLVAPALVVYELGNACWKKCRRDPGSAGKFRDAFANLSLFEIKLLAVEPPAVLATAEMHAVTYYDAAYLWLADRLKARLVTLDGRLLQLTKASGAH